MKRTLVSLAVLGICAGPAHGTDAATAAKVRALLQQMTLEEKVGQLNQVVASGLTGPENAQAKNVDKRADIKAGKIGSLLTVKSVAETRELQDLAMQSRLKIPLIFALDVIHGHKNVFPVPLGEAASWDMEAIERSARIAATEAAASGVHWTFAPMVDVARDPRWGRVMEGAGEDAFLGSAIAKARVKGFQGKGIGQLDSVMATAKHFAAYGAAVAGRDYQAVDISPQQLHEVYLPPFRAAVEAGVATFMNSFNTLNGIPATGSAMLQKDILRQKWGFDGIVVSDWQSVAEMVRHGYAADLKDAGARAINAGNTIDMEGYAYSNHLAELVKEGKVGQATLDDAVGHVLAKKFELGLFDDPYRYSDAAREKAVHANPEHRAATRDVARKSMVLLKNEGAVLPLKKDTRRIALIGPLAEARRDLEGAWIVHSDPKSVPSLADGLRKGLAAGSRLTVTAGCDIACKDSKGFAAAVKAAREADVVVMALGESFDHTGEARSYTSITLLGKQDQLFHQVRAAAKAAGKPVVLVVLAGRPLAFADVAEKADAILYAWLPGSEGGNAMADVLFGDYNPSGKLPITIPRSLGQVPIYYSYLNTGRPVPEVEALYGSAYMDSPNTPLYAFGHGLSYTTFKYDNLRLSTSSLAGNGKLTVSFDLQNSGKRAGEEVVQLYLRDPVASIARPVKELKGFRKLRLEPGQRQSVSFEIDRELLSFHNADLKWGAEPGRFDLMIGSASDDIRLKGQFELTD
ncbi:glycoside hydrolase family 3 N-terminal domain-containing protein [Pseudoduganella lutea]|uniref:Beta-D-glucoside glucohydrolase n=1 Tax=Pseudoduganella lutea TaxID=321985 RepID=A0A4P6KTL4_9BURK|nr:glycoside hydrolase family 3 N-terminal domain-containing protein [Pseudoduganella lutea]QBE61905.1 glycosyl hydrolase [Pseudoduganella lutea]